MIDRTTATVRRNLLEGCLLVIVVLFFFLRDVRASLIVAAVIPLSMLVGFIGMRLFGVSANLMSLGAIDFGLIVDGAVVMMENFVRRRAEVGDRIAHATGPHAHELRINLFRSAAVEVARPVLFGVLIIIAVYLPIFTLEGLEGKMFRPMAITVCSALFGSLLLSLTGVPVVSSYLLKLDGRHQEERWFVRLRDRYTHHLAGQMRHPVRTIAVALVLVVGALGSIPFLGTEFMPRLDEGSILIETRKLPSVSLEESVQISTRVEQIVLRDFTEVSQIVTKLGRPDLATEAMGIYQGDVYVLLHPEDEWDSGRDEGRADRRDGRIAGARARPVGELHPADGDAPRRGGVGHQGRRRGEGVRPRLRRLERIGAPGARRHRARPRRGRHPGRGAVGRRPARDPDRSRRHRPLRPARERRAGGGRDRGRWPAGHRDPRWRAALPGGRAAAGGDARDAGRHRRARGHRARRRAGAARVAWRRCGLPRRPRSSTTRTPRSAWSCRATSAGATSAASSPRRSGGWPGR